MIKTDRYTSNWFYEVKDYFASVEFFKAGKKKSLKNGINIFIGV